MTRHSESPDNDSTQTFSLDELVRNIGPARRARVPTLVCLTGALMGRVFRLEADTTEIGRAAREVTLDEAGVSRRHARIARTGDGFVLEDLGSTNGTACRGVRITGPVKLHAGDEFRIGPNVVMRFELRDEVEEQVREALYELATRDPLTHALNRRSFEERLASEWSWAVRHRLPCALLVLDVDHFKRVNDSFGHVAGDLVLQRLVQVVEATIRNEDVLARVGGEEFIVLARATPPADAVAMAERVRLALELQGVPVDPARIHFTVSIGIATTDQRGISSPGHLVARADAALYEAKNAGRNRVHLDRGGA